MGNLGNLSDDAIANLRRLKHDFEFFAATVIKIQDKAGNCVPLILNDAQKLVYAIIKADLDAGIPVRVCILKARQLGISTLIAAIFYHYIWGHKNVPMSIITHLSESSSRILDMIKFIHSNVPKQLSVSHLASNSNELVLDSLDKDGRSQGNNSWIEIHTAESPEQLRSGRFQMLHSSELAFWKKASKCKTAAFQTVPYLPGTIIAVESTANGKGNNFHDFWVTDNGFRKIFIGWQSDPGYCLPSNGFEPTDEEIEEAARAGLSLGQLAWRRWCIASNCEGNTDTFKQEYPSNPEEAFLSTGQCRFDTPSLSWYSTNRLLPDPILTGEIDCTGKTLQFEPKKINHKQLGGLTIWEPYKKRTNYAIFSDVSEGILFDDGRTGDRSGADVREIETRRKVAEWHGIVEHANFGRIEVFLARQYGNAVIVQEVNNHGHSAITAALAEGYPESLFFSREAGNDDEIEGTHRLGWLTSKTTKPIVTNNLAQMILHKSMAAISDQDLYELYTFIRHRNRTVGADINCFDDRVIKIAIAEYLLTNDFFISRWNKIYKVYEKCEKCRHYKKSTKSCYKTQRLCAPDDVCRLVSPFITQSSSDRVALESTKY